MTPEFIEQLREMAARETWEDDDDFDPCAFSGGNFDDAYYGGYKDGETNLAREILDAIR